MRLIQGLKVCTRGTCSYHRIESRLWRTSVHQILGYARLQKKFKSQILGAATSVRGTSAQSQSLRSDILGTVGSPMWVFLLLSIKGKQIITTIMDCNGCVMEVESCRWAADHAKLLWIRHLKPQTLLPVAGDAIVPEPWPLESLDFWHSLHGLMDLGCYDAMDRVWSRYRIMHRIKYSLVLGHKDAGHAHALWIH